MFRTSAFIAAALTVTAGAASAATLAAGQYSSVGIVASNNGSPNCAAVGLNTNAAVTSFLKYPGAGKTGFTIYTVPFGGGLQLCTGFPAVPAGGINGFSATAKCAIDSIGGNVPAQPVNFTFTNTVTDANSGVGTTQVSIPASDAVGGGCNATIDTTIVRTGK